jgi:hypothetical protein
MVWIKRNLYFLIGSLVAVILMIVGGIILFTQISQEAEVSDNIGKQYAELLRLKQLNPNPGDDKTINNIKAAQEQEKAVRAYIAKMRPFFQRIPPIPDPATNRISNAEFAAQLRITVAQLHRDAEQQSVILPPDYYFTFEAQKKIMNFNPSSLDSLAIHLGEVKVISEALFAAKINSLDGIRREVISDNDNNPPDYLPMKTVSTPLADLTPYEVTFRSFSGELALVLANFANSPYGLVIKNINVEPAAPTTAGEMAGDSSAMAAGQGAISPPPGGPSVYVGPDGRPIGRVGRSGALPGPAPVAPPVSSRGGQVFLTEKPLRVTLLIDVVKARAAAK